MEKMLAGYKQFRAKVFPQWKDHFHLLAESQSPRVLFITCADSRIVPDLIFQTEPGDMFLIRNAGNVVPPAGVAPGGATATIEYAVDVLQVEHIVICGHSDCGAVRAARRPELTDALPTVKSWLNLVQAAQAVGTWLLTPSGEDEGARFHDLVCANVVGQVANLRSQPAVARALVAGRLQVHGWYYDILNGLVEAYALEQRRFMPLEEGLPSSSVMPTPAR